LLNFSCTFANPLSLRLLTSSCVVRMTMPARQGFRRHQRGYFQGHQVYVDPAGLQLRFRFTMVASTSVPFVECPTRHVTCPYSKYIHACLNSPSSRLTVAPTRCVFTQSTPVLRPFLLPHLHPSSYTLLTPRMSSLSETTLVTGLYCRERRFAKIADLQVGIDLNSTSRNVNTPAILIADEIETNGCHASGPLVLLLVGPF
jgi:hypothetical protein